MHKTITVTVTKALKERGIPKSPQCCPVALALLEAGTYTKSELASESYAYADAMLAERNRKATHD